MKLLISVIISVLFISGCSGNKNTKKSMITKDQLTGKWIFVKGERTFPGSETKEYSNYSDMINAGGENDLIIQFNKDQSCSCYVKSGEKVLDPVSGKWELTADSLKILLPQRARWSYSCDIKNNLLVLETNSNNRNQKLVMKKIN